MDGYERRSVAVTIRDRFSMRSMRCGRRWRPYRLIGRKEDMASDRRWTSERTTFGCARLKSFFRLLLFLRKRIRTHMKRHGDFVSSGRLCRELAVRHAARLRSRRFARATRYDWTRWKETIRMVKDVRRGRVFSPRNLGFNEGRASTSEIPSATIIPGLKRLSVELAPYIRRSVTSSYCVQVSLPSSFSSS
jgi:hypothetical protein